MNIVQEALADCGAEIVGQISDETVVWKGTSYDAIVSTPEVSVDLESGGLMAEGEFRVKILRAAFNAGAGPFPQDGDTLTYDGDTFVTPNASRQRAGSAFIVFDLASHL